MMRIIYIILSAYAIIGLAACGKSQTGNMVENEHDMWVDLDYQENTGELSDIFDDADIDEYVNNLNDWD